jgi:thiamine-phosphate pyrophosphorylase
MTDDERLPDPVSTANVLPAQSLVVVRARDAVRRAELAAALMKISRRRHLKVIIAADPLLAMRSGAHGAHFPEAEMGRAAHWRALRPDWLITCAAHSLSACGRAGLAHADAVMLAPIFPTQSHRGRPSLGLFRASAIARLSPIPVYALGGIDGASAARLPLRNFAGIAAVGAWTDGQ